METGEDRKTIDKVDFIEMKNFNNYEPTVVTLFKLYIYYKVLNLLFLSLF